MATNNEAEYHALIEGLRAAKELGIKVNYCSGTATATLVEFVVVLVPIY